jgi:hypothetical protein
LLIYPGLLAGHAVRLTAAKSIKSHASGALRLRLDLAFAMTLSHVSAVLELDIDLWSADSPEEGARLTMVAGLQNEQLEVAWRSPVASLHRAIEGGEEAGSTVSVPNLAPRDLDGVELCAGPDGVGLTFLVGGQSGSAIMLARTPFLTPGPASLGINIRRRSGGAGFVELHGVKFDRSDLAEPQRRNALGYTA